MKNRTYPRRGHPLSDFSKRACSGKIVDVSRGRRRFNKLSWCEWKGIRLKWTWSPLEWADEKIWTPSRFLKHLLRDNKELGRFEFQYTFQLIVKTLCLSPCVWVQTTGTQKGSFKFQEHSTSFSDRRAEWSGNPGGRLWQYFTLLFCIGRLSWG